MRISKLQKVARIADGRITDNTMSIRQRESCLNRH